MAKLEFYRQRIAPQVEAPSVRGLAAIQSPAAQVAESIEQLALVGAKIQESRRASKLADLNAKATTELNQFVLSLENDSDYDTQLGRYNNYVKELETRVQDETKSDPRLFQMWKREFTVPVTARSFDVQKRALKGTTQRSRAELDDTLYSFSQLTGSGNSEQDKYAISQGVVALDNALVSGFISAEEEANMRQEFMRTASNNSANRALLADPEKFEISLKQGQFPELRQDDRLSFEKKAGEAVEAKLRNQRIEEDRERKLREDAIRRDGEDLIASGRLSAGWLRANRDDLSPEQYRYFQRALQGDEGQTNPTIYSGLLTRASSGQDVSAEARQAYIDGEIKQGDLDRLTSLSASSGWFKTGAQFISGSLRVSDLNPDPAAAQRLANAENDWREWAQTQDPSKVTPEKAMEVARSLVREYAIIDFQNSALLLRAPRFLVGPRDRPDLDATEDATVAAVDRGEMTPAEFAQQSKLIKQWRSSISAVQATEIPRAK